MPDQSERLIPEQNNDLKVFVAEPVLKDAFWAEINRLQYEINRLKSFDNFVNLILKEQLWVESAQSTFLNRCQLFQETILSNLAEYENLLSKEYSPEFCDTFQVDLKNLHKKLLSDMSIYLNDMSSALLPFTQLIEWCKMLEEQHGRWKHSSN